MRTLDLPLSLLGRPEELRRTLERQGVAGQEGMRVLSALASACGGRRPVVLDGVENVYAQIRGWMGDPDSWPADMIRWHLGGTQQVVWAGTVPAGLLWVARAAGELDTPRLQELAGEADRAWPAWRRAHAQMWARGEDLPIEWCQLTDHNVPARINGLQAEMFLVCVRDVREVGPGLQAKIRRWEKPLREGPQNLYRRFLELGMPPERRQGAFGRLQAAAQAKSARQEAMP